MVEMLLVYKSILPSKIFLLNICFKVLNRISVCVGEEPSPNSFKVLKVNVNIFSVRSLIINYVLEKRLEGERTTNRNLSLEKEINQ